MNAEETAHILFQHVVEPETLITDRCPQFAGRFLPTYLRLLGTQSRMSTAYHPQTDGRTERTNRVLECYLRTFVSPTLDDWDLYLPAAAFACNNPFRSSISNTPFFKNYGRHPHMPFASEIDHTVQPNVPAASDFAADLQETLNRAKRSLQSAQDRRQAHYNKNRPGVTYLPNQFKQTCTVEYSELLSGTRSSDTCPSGWVLFLSSE